MPLNASRYKPVANGANLTGNLIEVPAIETGLEFGAGLRQVRVAGRVQVSGLLVVIALIGALVIARSFSIRV